MQKSYRIYPKLKCHFLKELRIASFFLLKYFFLVFSSSSLPVLSKLMPYFVSCIYLLPMINYLVSKTAITLFFVKERIKDTVAT